MRNATLALLALLMLLPAVPLQAALVRDLYEVRVPVSDQSPAELKRAARAGLAEVLVRIAGRTDAARQPGVAELLANADRYVEQYRFEQVAPPAEPVADGAAPAVASAPSLQALLRFARPPLEQQLRKAGLPVWGENRPTLLVWLAVDENGSRQLVNEASHPALVQALREQARRRGLVVSFPLLDLDDLAAVTADMAWQMDMARLGQAAARYRADGLLVGRLGALPGGRWVGSWNLSAEDLRLSVDGEGAGLPEYLAPGIDRIADALASRYAVAPEAGAGVVTLWLTDVRSFADYSRVLQYLSRVSQIKAVVPLQVAPGEMLLRLEIDGTPAQLERALALDNKLQPEPATVRNPGSAQMRYRWVARYG
jgi:hypothetical protein